MAKKIMTVEEHAQLAKELREWGNWTCSLYERLRKKHYYTDDPELDEVWGLVTAIRRLQRAMGAALRREHRKHDGSAELLYRRFGLAEEEEKAA